MYTNAYICEKNHCVRKNFDYDAIELTGCLIIILITMVANAGGLGAGAVIIPVYIFVYRFSPTDSIPLSKITIFAGAIVNYILSWKERDHRRPNNFIINYSMAAVIVPLLLAGTQIGVVLSKFFPPFIIILGLIAYLLLSVTKMYERGVKEWNKENKEVSELLQQSRLNSNLLELANSEATTEISSHVSNTDKKNIAESIMSPSLGKPSEVPSTEINKPRIKNIESAKGIILEGKLKKTAKKTVKSLDAQHAEEVEVETHDSNGPDEEVYRRE